ncbi:MAG TPA: PAS domain S-box protein [Armatimonadetes bacterium]|nr:PAS domain S-box protein [Armatimonadota bacterium]
MLRLPLDKTGASLDSRGEDSVALERDRLDAALNATDEAILMIDEEYRFVLINDRVGELFGFTLKDLQGADFEALLERMRNCFADPQAFDRHLWETEHNPHLVVEEEVEIVCPERRVLRRRLGPVYDQKGTLIGRIITYRDVTREVEINQMKTEFVSNVSHELRTPLAAIKGFVSAIIEDADTMDEDTRRNFLGIVREETDRLSRLIDDLLDLSRIESGRLQMQEEVIDLADLVEDVILSIKAQAEEKGITLGVDIQAPHVRFVGDRDQLAQVLLNLLSNAIKFTPAGGKVRVRVEEKKDTFDLSVIDTGVGISAQDLPHIFEKFYRSRRAGVKMEGTGLGLPIAQELVERHGGTIEVESEEGKGSTFRVRLPKRRRRPQPQGKWGEFALGQAG